ncbi:MAG: hypothetical protein KDC42_08910 [Ignavibacteriae bacterium]|nr:hypothetical protein [Ignavibacteriota bacterium]
MKRVIFILTILIAGAALTGCGSRFEKSETQEFSPSAEGKSKIRIENVNGEVKVFKTEEDKIRIIAKMTTRVRRRDLDKPIKDISINIDESGNEIIVQTDMHDVKDGFTISFGNKRSVDYIVYVPARFEVNINNVSGNVEARDIEGDVNIDLVNGNINLDNISGAITTELINGNTSCEIYSTKGITFSTINGKITLKCPEDLSAKIYADVSNGRVVTDELDFTNSYKEKDHLSGSLGDGAADIRLETINGRITLGRIENKLTSSAGDKSKEEVYMLMKENYEKAKSEMEKAEEEFKKAEEEYLKGKDSIQSMPRDSVKTDSVKTL